VSLLHAEQVALEKQVLRQHWGSKLHNKASAQLLSLSTQRAGLLMQSD
jgi:hypothetical protein